MRIFLREFLQKKSFYVERYISNIGQEQLLYIKNDTKIKNVIAPTDIFQNYYSINLFLIKTCTFETIRASYKKLYLIHIYVFLTRTRNEKIEFQYYNDEDLIIITVEVFMYEVTKVKIGCSFKE